MSKIPQEQSVARHEFEALNHKVDKILQLVMEINLERRMAQAEQESSGMGTTWPPKNGHVYIIRRSDGHIYLRDSPSTSPKDPLEFLKTLKDGEKVLYGIPTNDIIALSAKLRQRFAAMGQTIHGPAGVFSISDDEFEYALSDITNKFVP